METATTYRCPKITGRYKIIQGAKRVQYEIAQVLNGQHPSYPSILKQFYKRYTPNEKKEFDWKNIKDFIYFYLDGKGVAVNKEDWEKCKPAAPREFRDGDSVIIKLNGMHAIIDGIEFGRIWLKNPKTGHLIGDYKEHEIELTK